MNRAQLHFALKTLLFISLLYSGASVAEEEYEKMAKRIHKTPVETCKAVLNINLKKISRIDECVKGGAFKVKKIEGRDCATHYTLYPEACQCNDAKHSELLVLQDKPKIKSITNLKNPCINCYHDIVKHMINSNRLDKGEDLTIKYKNKGDTASLNKHEKLKAACKAYKRDHPDDFI